MNKIIIVISVAILLIGVGFFFFWPKKSNKSTVPNKSYTLAEISSHNNANDCWMAIDGKVYDVTKFIPKHEGGDQILLGCGKDATDLFNNRPGGKGPHPGSAQAILPEYEIGILVN